VITQSRLKELFDYNPETGLFTYKYNSAKKFKAGDVAGYLTKRGYVTIRVDRCLYLASRLAWLYMFGYWSSYNIDHINGIKNDNRISNLRETTQAQNKQNLYTKPKGSLGSLLGTTFKNHAWEASIKHDGKSYYLGRFKTEAEAHAAYLGAKKVLHPFSNL
jgi:hypothetical protein